MSHVVERCDFLDVLEESARLQWAIFRGHDRVLIDDIASYGPAEPPEPSYRGKL